MAGYSYRFGITTTYWYLSPMDQTDYRIKPTMIPVARRPSAMAMNEAGTRLYAVSASTDRITVIDTETLEVVTLLEDPAPEGPHEGSTPNALLLSEDETRLYVAEADKQCNRCVRPLPRNIRNIRSHRATIA